MTIIDSPSTPEESFHEYRWKVAYLHRRIGSHCSNLEDLDLGLLKAIHEQMLANTESSAHRKLIELAMQTAWRQYQKRNRDKANGFKQHSFTLSEQAMKELKKLARLKGMGLNETMEYIIQGTYRSIPTPPKKTTRKSQANKKPLHQPII